MPPLFSRKAAAILTLAGLAAGAEVPAKSTKKDPEKAVAAEQAAFFEKEVRPILAAHCVACHGGEEKIKGGLKLTSRADVLKGGRSGPAVDVEKPDDSLLLDAINYRSPKMPPKGKLPQAQIDALTRWVQMGAPWPEGIAVVKHGPPP